MESYNKVIVYNVLIFSNLSILHGFGKIYLKYNVL